MKFLLSLAILMLSAVSLGQGVSIIGLSPTNGGTCLDDGDVDTLETICTVTVSGYSSITFQGTVATSAFSDFNIDLSNDCSTYINYYTASADYTSPSGYLHSASADLTTWTTTALSFKLDGLAGIGCVRLQAAGTNSDPAITWRLQ